MAQQSDALWRNLIAFGIGTLRLSPKDFWAMTPKEFAALAGPFLMLAADHPDRATLAALAARYPDQPTKDNPT